MLQPGGRVSAEPALERSCTSAGGPAEPEAEHGTVGRSLEVVAILATWRSIRLIIAGPRKELCESEIV